MMSRSKKNVDRLSHLPDEILSQILSLMPTKSAVTTSVLSTRWRYAWTFVTNVDFDDSQCKPSFPEFVSWVLDSCKTSTINLFRLRLSYNTVAQTSSVSNWIDKAVRLNVLELHITNYAMYRCELPLSLFTCKTLTILRISSTRFQEFSCPVNLPSLKILDIVGYLYNLGLAFKFIGGCPVLESLSLDVSSETNQGDYTFNIPTLKRLKLALLRCNQYTRVVLNVSNLECLIVGGCQLPSFVMEDVSSLVEASISAYVQAPNHVWAELLEGVSGVKSLSLGYIPRGLLLPIFPNLMRLELKSRWHWGRIKIFHILESCPKLKHLYIKKHVGSGLRNPKSVPTCLLTNLTTVKFSKCKGSQCDIQFLGYILGNAKFLKTVTITWNKSRINEEARLCTRLLKHKRASSCCEIQFHGSLSHSSIS